MTSECVECGLTQEGGNHGGGMKVHRFIPAGDPPWKAEVESYLPAPTKDAGKHQTKEMADKVRELASMIQECLPEDIAAAGHKDAIAALEAIQEVLNERSKPDWTPTDETVLALARSTSPARFVWALDRLLGACTPSAKAACVVAWVERGLVSGPLWKRACDLAVEAKP